MQLSEIASKLHFAATYLVSLQSPVKHQQVIQIGVF